MSQQEILDRPEPVGESSCIDGGGSDIQAWFASATSDFGSVLLESSLRAYGRGGRTYAATNPVDSWVIEPKQAIPVNWIQQLDSFLADESAFYALFFSYEFGAEIVAGPTVDNPNATPEYKALALKYSAVRYGNSLRNGVGPVDASLSASKSLGSASALIRPDQGKYLKDLARIKNHIHEGDIYQANLTAEWQIESDASPWDVYRRLQRLNPCQYGAYANLGDYTILSSSPERLVSVNNREITANPIKGTIAKGNSPQENENNLRQLQSSEKDRAELLMIVDLLRNDIGKVCQTGSVETPVMWRPETYSSVIHLVSEIKGLLRSDVTTAEIINAVFPGGSITGAPKRRAIRILRDIESRNRGIYTGSIGYKYGAELDLNIAIRTLTYSSTDEAKERTLGVYRAQAGGGIVADSDAESEFGEAELKVSNLLKAVDPGLLP